MPELPEVETIKRIIELQIIGSVIQKVEVRNEQVIAHPAAENFAQSLSKQRFSRLGRWGKFLIFHFENGMQL